ncbi:MAG: hypothetical protein IJS94_05760 [Clostridia bacterium]|nr:hypothetical protein [Clostridia bacterium]
MKNRLNTAKKAAALLLAAAALFLVSCKKNVVVNPGDSSSAATASSYPTQPKATNTETIGTEVVYNANGVTVKTEALDFSDNEKVRVKFRIFNESQLELKVMVPKDEEGKNTVVVNGKKVQANMIKTLQKPETVVWMDMYWIQLREEYGIETIDDIELKLVFTEAFTRDETPLFSTDLIKISTQKAN